MNSYINQEAEKIQKAIKQKQGEIDELQNQLKGKELVGVQMRTNPTSKLMEDRSRK